VRLAVVPAEIHTRGVNPHWVRVGDPVAGRDVLVVDDTWVSGGSAQSAAAALKLAGARRVAVLVLGRHVNPADPASARFLTEIGEIGEKIP
jgi:orotate phosphoribosyltransferase